MIFKISELFSRAVMKEHIVDEKDVALHEYGFQIMLANLFNLCIIVVIGLVSGDLLKSMVFYVVFISLRIYTGGFHASSYRRCFLLFSTICVTCIIASNWLLKHNFILLPFLISAIILGIAIYFMAPIPHENRQISSEEKVLFKNKSWLVYSVWIIIAVILLVTEFWYIVSIITVTLLAVSILMVVSGCTIHNERGDESEKNLSGMS